MHSSIVNGQPWQYNASIALFRPQATLPSKKLKHMQHLQRHKNQSLSQDYPILQHCIPNLHLNTLSNPQSHASKEPFSCHMNMTSTIRPFISLPISPLCCELLYAVQDASATTYIWSPVLIYCCYSMCHVTELHSKPPTIGLKPMG